MTSPFNYLRLPFLPDLDKMTGTKRPPHGFPAGYFVIYSLATERFLNVWFNLAADGTEIVVWSVEGKPLDECVFRWASVLDPKG
jgi:hypothetical protein